MKKSRSKKPQEINCIIDQEHGEALRYGEHLNRAIQNLRFEGKLALGKNLREVRNSLDFFLKHGTLRMGVEERKIFPFIEAHVPKLEPVILLLKSEHEQIRTLSKKLRACLEEFKRGSEEVVFSQDALQKFIDEGIYLACLFRHHIETEDSVYRMTGAEMSAAESKDFQSRLSQMSPGTSWREYQHGAA